ncbi:hypothetical protein ACIQ7Q_10805 [Streptomyces sp. NPDC096176]|uniref:hypothetical protein n=1 Tax=Streptomyces sp. NPDC096176 TaxID=3366079 RepID=UPI003828D01A
MTQLSRHGKLALEYWQAYRPRALANLGSPEEQAEFFHALDLRLTERIGMLADDLLQELPSDKRATARRAVRSQAQERVYAEEVFLEKEPGTEHREI